MEIRVDGIKEYSSSKHFPCKYRYSCEKLDTLRLWVRNCQVENNSSPTKMLRCLLILPRREIVTHLRPDLDFVKVGDS